MTVHVPTRSPPQGTAFEQELPAPPLPVVPPVATWTPLSSLPPVPEALGGAPDLEPHAQGSNASPTVAASSARAAGEVLAIPKLSARPVSCNGSRGPGHRGWWSAAHDESFTQPAGLRQRRRKVSLPRLT